jgi:drug/metabolite transporter (DMT)-like permease
VHPALAVVLAVGSAACYAVSAAIQHREASRQTGAGAALLAGLLRRRLWWTAQACTLLGALVHLAALAAGPLVLVQPVGVLALVLALPVGARFGGGRVTASAWAGAACVVVGLPAVLAMVPHHGEVGAPVVPFPVAAAVVGAVVALAAAGAAVVRHRRQVAAVLHAGGAALCFGMTSGSVKSLWTGAGGPVAVLVGLATVPIGIALAQHAYRGGGLGAPLAVQTLADPVTAVAVGILVLGEPLVTSPARIALGVAGIAATAVGVALLSSRGARTAPLPPPAVAAPAAHPPVPQPPRGGRCVTPR